MAKCELCRQEGKESDAKYAILLFGVPSVRLCLNHYNVVRKLEDKVYKILITRECDKADK